ncbi:hypothetical protein Forpe1208_v009879 [Fusarium oxysporum f. sp. rapae]|uniref:Uncharacterized protein n=1 Tax=Fusarium oxysporum f. sp. rapae TaxID=485398 RepID=A0A8J5NS26_FUSOX|nr:hypothetical protein Forpe1208_v009879 [Fusarium oxysporum f. sp. rapae]
MRLTFTWKTSDALQPRWANVYEGIKEGSRVLLGPSDARERLLQVLRPVDILGANVRLAQKLVTEAEAAAIALLSASANTGNLEGLNFQAKDTVIICDCGGGTTDLISYQVLSMRPLAVREISPSKSIYAGAALLDDGFMELLKARTKAERPRPTFKLLTDEDFNKFADSIWHNDMKRNHSVDMEGQIVDLPPRFLGIWVDRTTMAFTAGDINGLFDPIVHKIVNLIDSEMAVVKEETGEQATHVVVAGGLGRNHYLWTSVARGAVLHAIQTKSQSTPSIVQIEARASGESYGVGIGNGGPHPLACLLG